MARYIDAFVLIVPKKKLAAYTKMSKKASAVWLDYGALQYVETKGDDLKGPCGINFDVLTKAKKTEAVVFSWIMYKNRAHRNRVNAKVMKDKRLAAMMDPTNMPFDMNRMSMGGFETIVDI